MDDDDWKDNPFWAKPVKHWDGWDWSTIGAIVSLFVITGAAAWLTR